MKKQNFLVLLLSATCMLASCDSGKLSSDSSSTAVDDSSTMTSEETGSSSSSQASSSSAQDISSSEEESSSEISSSEEQSSSENDYATVAYATHEEYIAAENDTELKVQGIVTFINQDASSAFIQNGKDGYQIYDALAVAKMEVGKTYTVVGVKAFYNGQHEISDVVYVKENTEALTSTITDISSMNFVDPTAMLVYYGSNVELKNAIVTSVPSMGDKAFSITLTANEHNATLRVDPKNLSESDFEAVKTFFTTTCPEGGAIDVTAIMSAFGYKNPYNPQLQLVDASKLIKATLPDADVVANAKNVLNLPSSVASDITSISLPTSITGNDATISYTSSNEAVIQTNGKVTHAATDMEVVITATIRKNDVTDTKVFHVVVVGTTETGTLVYTETFTHNNSTTEGNYGQSGIKQGYANAEATFTPNYTWEFDNALHGGSTSDHIYVNEEDDTDTWCARVKPTSSREEESSIYTKFSVTNLAYVDFYAACYGTYAGTTCYVSYSLDGTTWTRIEQSFELSNESSYYRAYINATGEVRVKFTFENENKSATSNIDEIRFFQSK